MIALRRPRSLVAGFFWLVPILASVLLFAACGGSARPLTAGTATPTATAEIAATVPPTPTVVEPTSEPEPAVDDQQPEAEVTLEPSPLVLEALSGRIAYVTADLRIWTVSPDGTDKRLVTPEEGRYAWPTWAPDGKTVAYSAITDGEETTDVSLFAVTDGGDDRRVLYRGDPEYAGILVAPKLPHYAVWSPDGERLAFITGGESGLEVYVDDLRDSTPPTLVAGVPPVYLSWSSNSRYVLVHRGGNHLLVDTEQGMEVQPLDSFATGYRAPAWWPSGDVMTVVDRDDQSGRYGVYMQNIGDTDGSTLGESAARVAFLWSPTGEWLALGRSDTPGLPAYEEVVLVSPNGDQHPTSITGIVIAFFWSPDGSMLAYVTTTDTAGVWTWTVLDVETGQTRKLIEFVASDDFVIWLQFFDQFIYSHQLWSPDSNAIVFSGRVAVSSVGASTGVQETDQVIVMTVGRLPTVDLIAEGTMAFWSPQ